MDFLNHELGVSYTSFLLGDLRFEASATPRGIKRLSIPHIAEKKPSPASFQKGEFLRLEKGVSRLFDSLGKYLMTFFRGRNPGEIPPLDLEGISCFSRNVYEVVMDVDWGETVSYQSVASTLGREGAARAVGRALASNPLPILIPCHRVICSDGSLGGYNLGLEWKKFLLGLESKKRAGEE